MTRRPRNPAAPVTRIFTAGHVTVRGVETPSRIAVVTGGGSGIGRAVALGLVAHGYTVVVSGRRGEALEETVRRAGANAASVLAVPGNVADPESVRRCSTRFASAAAGSICSSTTPELPASPRQSRTSRWSSGGRSSTRT
jgi:shikimate 5-dehydrogenase